MLLRALTSRNYRLFLVGQGISLIGTWMQQVAMSWLVYRLTGSVLLLGVTGFAGQIPNFLLAPVAGVMADRWNRRPLLLITQSLAMLQAVLLATLVLTGSIQVWQLIGLSVILGVVNAFDIPIRQSFVIELMDKKEDLSNAIALNSSMVNSARLIGPALAGVLVAALGEGVCFILNGASYLAVILALAAMRLGPTPARPESKHFLKELGEGFTYAFGSLPIRSILALLALISLMGMPYSVLLPFFAKEVLHGGAHTFGFLVATTGSGALAGTIYLASRQSVRGLGRVIVAATILFSTGIIGFALSRSLLLSLVCLALVGFGGMALVASSNTILQTLVDDDKRGRIMSLFSMAFVGMTPIGSLMAGAAADRIGAPTTLMLGGGFCLVGGLLFARELPALRQQVRSIYVQKGIITGVATGFQTDADLVAPPAKHQAAAMPDTTRSDLNG